MCGIYLCVYAALDGRQVTACEQVACEVDEVSDSACIVKSSSFVLTHTAVVNISISHQ
jgi:hypothetical protein